MRQQLANVTKEKEEASAEAESLVILIKSIMWYDLMTWTVDLESTNGYKEQIVA